jgi:hypothetical protein
MQIESNTSRSHHAVDDLSATSRSHNAADALPQPAFMAPAYIGTNPAFIGTSCDNRNVTKYDNYVVTRSAYIGTSCDDSNVTRASISAH